MFLLKYWQPLAMSIGTYDDNDITAGGTKGLKIRDQIKEDYARFDL